MNTKSNTKPYDPALGSDPDRPGEVLAHRPDCPVLRAEADAGPEEFNQSSHDFTLQAVMETQKSLGEFTAKIDRLIDDVGRFSARLRAVETAVDRVKTASIVACAVFSVIGVVLWWTIGDRITVAVRNSISTNPPAATAPIPTPVPK